MKIEWLQKPLANSPSLWTIATTEEEFNFVQDSQSVPREFQDSWTLHEGSKFDGMTHYFDGLIVVCLPTEVNFSVVVHEAVHVFEAMMRDMGEAHPSEEFRAYATQFIFERMVDALTKRVKSMKGGEA